MNLPRIKKKKKVIFIVTHPIVTLSHGLLINY